MYYLWASLLFLSTLLAGVATIVTLPGTWAIVGLTATFVALVPVDEGQGIGWTTVVILLLLAVAGELIETAASAAGAARQGASRRAMVLALVGTVAGSLVGAVVGLPVPVIGPILGALGGGAAGAFLGAFLGETSKGRATDESLSIGKAALVGRLLGTLGKLLVAALMVVIVAIDLVV